VLWADVLESRELILLGRSTGRTSVMVWFADGAVDTIAVEVRPEAIRMMITAYADLEAVIHAVNEGRIHRYIRKPWEENRELELIVRRAIESYQLAHERAQLSDALREANERLRRENLYLRSVAERRYAFEEIIGESPAMQKVFEVLEKVPDLPEAA